VDSAPQGNKNIEIWQKIFLCVLIILIKGKNMKVNRVNHTPNFGMSLKIGPDAEALLKEQFNPKQMAQLKEIIKQQEGVRPNMYLSTGYYVPRGLFDNLFRGTSNYEYLVVRVRRHVFADNWLFSTPMRQIKKALKYIDKYNQKHAQKALTEK